MMGGLRCDPRVPTTYSAATFKEGVKREQPSRLRGFA